MGAPELLILLGMLAIPLVMLVAVIALIIHFGRSTADSNRRPESVL